MFNVIGIKPTLISVIKAKGQPPGLALYKFLILNIGAEEGT
jgi:hypothetical protein